jgi:hypothetical protein
VLVAEEITRHRSTINTRETAWVRKNINMLVQTYRDQARDRGFWVVTKTYTTRRCAVAVMTAESASVEIAVSTNVRGLLVLEPGLVWRSAASGTSTDVHIGKEAGDGDEDSDDVVVFMGGVHFWRHPVLGTKEVTKQRDQRPFVRGDEDGGPQPSVLEIQIEGENEVWAMETVGMDRG